MHSNPATNGPITAAQRAQLIQRVLVDGWSPAQVARSCGFEERQIARWVADYRRRGMASLRSEIASERLYRRAIGRIRAALFQGFGFIWRGVASPTYIVLPNAHDDERRRR
ncbi:MAG TPA: helix-turn-helix domain-containing protein [Stellaceae bacterium]